MMRILFVDDCADDVLLATTVLRRAGLAFEERTAADFDEARAALAQGKWSVVVSDYNLGEHTGLDVLRLVRQHDPDMPFILVSGTVGEERAAEAIREGASDYVMKDRLARLPSAVRREIERAAALREHRALEARLRRMEERYRKTVEGAPIGIANVDAETRFIYINSRFCEMLGYGQYELLGRRFSDFGHPDDNAAAEAAFREILSGERTTAHYDRRCYRKDGSIMCASVSLAVVRDANGGLEHVICLVEDITEQRASREKLRYQTRLLECVDQAVVATDLDFRVTYWNASAETMYGWTEAEALGRSIIELTEPGGQYRQDVRELLAHGVSWSGQVIKRRRDGRPFPALLVLSPLFDESGRMTGIVAVCHDLTAGMRAEADLRESRLQLAEAQELARMGSWTYDFTTGERQWSDAFYRIAAFDPASKPSLADALERVHPEDRDRVAAIAAEAVHTLTPGSVEFRAITSEGERIFVVRYTFTRDSWGAPLKSLGVVQDVTESKQRERELRQRSVQQSAVANLGQVALSGASLPFLVEQAVESIRAVLQLASAAVVQKEQEHVLTGATAIRVPIHFADGSLWGYLGGQAFEHRTYAPHDVDFLRSMATVIGQALERREAEAALARRARQQSAIARLGSRVLTSFDNSVLDVACELLRTGTGADFIFVELTRLQPQLSSGDAFQVPVASATRIFGLLTTTSHRAEDFGPEDLDFIQTVANTLAEAMEREYAHDALQESENHFRRIFDGATEIIFSVDTRGRYMTLNPAFETITGWSREEWLGRPFMELLAPGEGARLYALLRDMLQTRRTITETTVLRGRDRDIIVDVTAFPKVDNGEVREIYGFARDVTEARRAAEEQERLTRSLEMLLESTVEGIYTVDVDGRCTMINRAAAAFLGLDREEILDQSVHELLHRRADGSVVPIDECGVHGVLRLGDVHTATADWFRRKDGVLIPVSYSAAPIIDDGVIVGAVITFTDVSEKLKLEAKLEQVTRLSSLGRLAATVAHEFNNVLMGIAPFVEAVRRAPSPQHAAKALDHITASVKRGRRITEDILRFARPAQPVRMSVDVQSWLQGIAVEAKSLIGVRHEVIVDAEPLHIDVDPNQLHQVFTNLILNARDAMPHGGTITLTARREAPDARFPFGTVDDPSRFAHLIAADTGVGMNEETLRHAFEPLFTTKKNGTGLGLPVAHQVVQRHGGEIFIESTPGLGSAFHVFLPLSAPQEVAIAGPAGERPQQESLTRRILLVEDDPAVAAGLRALLECENFEVTAVDTGRAAIDSVQRERPDAVLLDVGLPDMEGTAVMTRLLADHPRLPILFSTGHADRGKLEELLTAPNVGFLLKPYEGDVLMKALAEVMAAR